MVHRPLEQRDGDAVAGTVCPSPARTLDAKLCRAVAICTATAVVDFATLMAVVKVRSAWKLASGNDRKAWTPHTKVAPSALTETSLIVAPTKASGPSS